MVRKYLKVLNHPVTQFNLLTVGMLILIQTIHTRAHHSYEVDVHGYVHQFIQENPDACPKDDW
tara:strand:- start:1992 stop:2180 length:189 start_codon:yes stop_codon:yes gene_type:complete